MQQQMPPQQQEMQQMQPYAVGADQSQPYAVGAGVPVRFHQITSSVAVLSGLSPTGAIRHGERQLEPDRGVHPQAEDL
jgi:hypothetical protein